MGGSRERGVVLRGDRNPAWHRANGSRRQPRGRNTLGRLLPFPPLFQDPTARTLSGCFSTCSVFPASPFLLSEPILLTQLRDKKRIRGRPEESIWTVVKTQGWFQHHPDA